MYVYLVQKLDECMMHLVKNIWFGSFIEAMITKVSMPVYLIWTSSYAWCGGC